MRDALDFPIPLVQVTERVWALELFHGPTLAFKDVGARVQARLLHHFTDGTPLTILVATSGDTGSAVAQAFHGVPDTRVVVLYPEGQVSDVQEAQMASLGDNITAVAVRGTFDDCQRLVKQAFADDELRKHVWLTPANSINLGRLLPQVFYYFVLARLRAATPIVSVPSGNFGNLTAGLIAKRIGLPVRAFVAATNVNDVVPEYLRSGIYQPRPSVRTVANAMDVGAPSNFERMQALYDDDIDRMRRDVAGAAFDDARVVAEIGRVYREHGYLLDPHGAIAWLGAAGGARRRSDGDRRVPRDGASGEVPRSRRAGDRRAGADCRPRCAEAARRGRATAFRCDGQLSRACRPRVADRVMTPCQSRPSGPNPARCRPATPSRPATRGT